MSTPKRLSQEQTIDYPREKATGENAPSQGLDTLTLGCLPLSRCGSAAVAFLATPIYESMTDASEPTNQPNSEQVETCRDVTPGACPLHATRATPMGGCLYTTPLLILGRFGRKGCKGTSQASERLISIEGGRNKPVAVGYTRVNGGGVR